MDKVDERIGRALADEDRALLARYGERDYFSEARGMFPGPMAGVMKLVYVTVPLTFVGALYALWKMAAATDPTTAVQWGVGALLLFQMTALSNSCLGSHMEGNRRLRELKRLELQVSLQRK